MKFSEIATKIEERKEPQNAHKLKIELVAQLAKAHPKNYKRKALIYFYLLQVSLLDTPILYESMDLKEYYHKMTEYFIKECRRILAHPYKYSQQINETYYLIEKSYNSLEVIYQDKHFFDRYLSAYKQKMSFRKKKFLISKQYWKFFEYLFLEITSNYGNSFLRWGLTSLFFGLFLAGIYAILDYRLLPELRLIPKGNHFYDYIYFSLSTLTSLGIGDYVPKTFLAKFFSSLEVFFGFVMLGIFVNLIQRKL